MKTIRISKQDMAQRISRYRALKPPPGQGAGLHSHRQTYETFTVLRGRFENS